MISVSVSPPHSLFHANFHAPCLHAATTVTATAAAAAHGDVDLAPRRPLDELGEELRQAERGFPRGPRHARQHRPRRERAVEARLQERNLARGTHADVEQAVVRPGSYRDG